MRVSRSHDGLIAITIQADMELSYPVIIPFSTTFDFRHLSHSIPFPLRGDPRHAQSKHTTA